MIEGEKNDGALRDFITAEEGSFSLRDFLATDVDTFRDYERLVTTPKLALDHLGTTRKGSNKPHSSSTDGRPGMQENSVKSRLDHLLEDDNTELMIEVVRAKATVLPLISGAKSVCENCNERSHVQPSGVEPESSFLQKQKWFPVNDDDSDETGFEIISIKPKVDIKPVTPRSKRMSSNGDNALSRIQQKISGMIAGNHFLANYANHAFASFIVTLVVVAAAFVWSTNSRRFQKQGTRSKKKTCEDSLSTSGDKDKMIDTKKVVESTKTILLDDGASHNTINNLDISRGEKFSLQKDLTSRKEYLEKSGFPEISDPLKNLSKHQQSKIFAPMLGKEDNENNRKLVSEATKADNHSKSSEELDYKSDVDEDAKIYHPQDMHHAATKIAQDIKIVQDIFEQMRLDTSLAPQIALNLRSSHHLLTTIEHAQSKDTCYDPNWKDKLRRRRNDCWSAAWRLFGEIILTQTLIKVLQPIWHVVYSTDDSSLITSTKLLQLAVSSTCDCQSSDILLLHESVDNVGTFWFSLVSSTTDMLWQMWYWDSSRDILEKGACFAYCLGSFAIVSMTLLVGHQVLRAFSAPSIVHHGINCIAFVCLYGGSALSDMLNAIGPEYLIVSMIGILGILVVVQWTYQTQRHLINHTKDFRSTWDQTVDVLDSLKFKILMTRVVGLVIAGSFLWKSCDDDIESTSLTCVA